MESLLREKPKKRAGARPARPKTTRKPAATAAPTHEEIALRAHALFAQSGYVHGRDQEFWLEAERQLLAERQA